MLTKLKIWFKNKWINTLLFILGIYLTSLLEPIFSTFNKLFLPKFLTVIFYLANYNIPFYTIPLSFLIIIVFNVTYRNFRIKSRSFKILSATYGSGNTFIDITNQLNDAVEDNKLKIVMSNNIAGDPTPGIRKKGKIRYEYANKESEIEYAESDTIDLPPN